MGFERCKRECYVCRRCEELCVKVALQGTETANCIDLCNPEVLNVSECHLLVYALFMYRHTRTDALFLSSGKAHLNG